MNAPNARPTRGTLIRWGAWFGLLNGVLFALIGIRYLLIFGAPQGLLATVYVGLAYVAQFALLGFLPFILLSLLIAIVWPRKGLLLTLGVIVGSLGLSLMVLDTNVFEQYRFHLSALSVALFDTSTWVLTALVFLALLGLQAMLAGSVWKFVVTRPSRKGGLVALALVLVWCGGQGIHIWADATAYTQVTSFTRFMPLYFPMKAKRRLAKLGWVDPDEVEKRRMLRQANAPDAGQLRYPLSPLSCSADTATTPNIVILLVDALRPDRLNAQSMPATAEFAEQSLQFTDHYSGGNSSRMGFFSIFYGLPSTYWQSFYDLQRQPVLFDELQKRDYEIAAFSSVGFGSPSQIDRTVFAAVPPEARRVPESNSVDGNTQMTNSFSGWLQQRDDGDQPYFGLVYYDPGSFPTPDVDARADGLSDLERRDAEYMEKMAAADNEVARALAAVDVADNGRETLVIVTSDHGYEFDELGLGYIGHASNYAQWQLRSTLLMRWPGRAPEVFDQRTAHQDLPATLLQELFDCDNPASDYSSGQNLFTGESWEWIMAGSYTSHAIIEPEQIVVTYPGGLIELLGTDYRPDSSLELNPGRMQDAMIEMRRFYK